MRRPVMCLLITGFLSVSLLPGELGAQVSGPPDGLTARAVPESTRTAHRAPAEYIEARLTNDGAVSTNPRAVVDASYLYVTWEDTRDGNQEVYWQKFERATGTPVTGPIRITSTSATSTDPSIGVDNSGNSYLTWKEGGGTNPIWATKIDPSGATLVAPLIVLNGDYQCPDIAVAGDGTNVIVAQIMGIADQNVRNRRGASDLSLICTSVLPGAFLAITKYPTVTMDGTNSFIAWREWEYLSDRMYCFGKNPSCNGGEALRMDATNTRSCIDAGAIGIFVGYGRSGNVYDMIASNSDQQVNDVAGTAGVPRVACGSSVGYYIWHDSRNGNYDIYVSEASNTQTPYTDLQVTTNASSQTNPDITCAADAPNEWWAVWQDNRDGNYEIYMAGSLTTSSSSITGTVVDDASGAILSGISVHVTDGGTVNENAVTASDGSFEFTLLPEGAYDLDFSGNGYETLEITDFSASNGYNDVGQVRLILNPGVYIVVDENNNLIRSTDAQVEVVLTQAGSSSAFSNDEFGHVLLLPAAEGSHIYAHSELQLYQTLKAEHPPLAGSEGTYGVFGTVEKENTSELLEPQLVEAGTPRVIRVARTVARLNLIVTIMWDADNAFLSTLEQKLTEATRNLYDATNGYFVIDSIEVYDCAEDGLIPAKLNSSDITVARHEPNPWLDFPDDNALDGYDFGQPQHYPFFLGAVKGTYPHIHYGYNLMDGQYAIATSVVHELGHYMLLIDDEYTTLFDCAVDWQTNQTSLMCNNTSEIGSREINEFCWSGVHSNSPFLPQNKTHDGKDCWQTIVESVWNDPRHVTPWMSPPTNLVDGPTTDFTPTLIDRTEDKGSFSLSLTIDCISGWSPVTTVNLELLRGSNTMGLGNKAIIVGQSFHTTVLGARPNDVIRATGTGLAPGTYTVVNGVADAEIDLYPASITGRASGLKLSLGGKSAGAASGPVEISFDDTCFAAVPSARLLQSGQFAWEALSVSSAPGKYVATAILADTLPTTGIILIEGIHPVGDTVVTTVRFTLFAAAPLSSYDLENVCDQFDILIDEAAFQDSTTLLFYTVPSPSLLPGSDLIFVTEPVHFETYPSGTVLWSPLEAKWQIDTLLPHDQVSFQGILDSVSWMEIASSVLLDEQTCLSQISMTGTYSFVSNHAPEGQFSFTTPLSGIALPANSVKRLEWSYTALSPDSVRLYVSYDRGASYTDLLAVLPGDSLGFNWIVPENTGDSIWIAGLAFAQGTSAFDVAGGIWTSSCCIGIRGNIDGDPTEEINVSDVTFLVAYMFRGGPQATCFEEADINGSGTLNITDLTFIVGYLFQGGPTPTNCP